jgi:hypothetical protein
MDIIHYVLIARNDRKILCDFSEEGGNIPQIAIRLLKKVKANHKTIISYDNK